MKNSILVIGDLHGKFKLLCNYLNSISKNYDYIFCTGEFGYWPEFCDFNDLKLSENTKFYWCDGNHERHDLIKNICNNEISKNIFYMKRGSVLTINDKNILFFGGANSIDYKNRTPGIDWFPEENISINDMNNLPNKKIDIIISHTCPLEFDISKHFYLYDNKETECNRKYLSEILKMYNPYLWYFGHWHKSMEYKYKNTKFIGLNKINFLKWTDELEI